MTFADRLDIQAAIDRARTFSGWSFDGVDGVPPEAALPWDYEERARGLIWAGARVLDLGTGGGEVFSRIAGASMRYAVATEEWGPNSSVAAKRLAELAVPVVRASSLALPFASSSFDVVLSRHEEIEPSEVDRVLPPGGKFLTQQVCPEHWPEIRRFFPRATVFTDHWREYQEWFRNHGYEIEAQRHDYEVSFESLAGLVFMLLVAPWEVPGFDVERDEAALRALEDANAGSEGIKLTEGRYLLLASKPRRGKP